MSRLLVVMQFQFKMHHYPIVHPVVITTGVVVMQAKTASMFVESASLKILQP